VDRLKMKDFVHRKGDQTIIGPIQEIGRTGRGFFLALYPHFGKGKFWKGPRIFVGDHTPLFS